MGVFIAVVENFFDEKIYRVEGGGFYDFHLKEVSMYFCNIVLVLNKYI